VGPSTDSAWWKARPTLPAELNPVLDRIKGLATGGLTSLMVLGDFLMVLFPKQKAVGSTPTWRAKCRRKSPAGWQNAPA
jgi:hypothetical protein